MTSECGLDLAPDFNSNVAIIHRVGRNNTKSRPSHASSSFVILGNLPVPLCWFPHKGDQPHADLHFINMERVT
jgi:hypothetical protein